MVTDVESARKDYIPTRYTFVEGEETYKQVHLPSHWPSFWEETQDTNGWNCSKTFSLLPCIFPSPSQMKSSLAYVSQMHNSQKLLHNLTSVVKILEHTTPPKRIAVLVSSPFCYLLERRLKAPLGTAVVSFCSVLTNWCKLWNGNGTKCLKDFSEWLAGLFFFFFFVGIWFAFIF